jgi:hypothetical protein
MCTRTGASALASGVALAAGLSVALPLRADTEPGFYLGVGGGNSHLALGDEQLSVEAHDIGDQVFAGYNFGRYDAEVGLGFDTQRDHQSIDLSDGDFFMLGVSGLYRF